MTKVTRDKMYQLEIKVLTKDDLKVVHANVARLFGVETKKENMQTLSMWHKQLAHLNHTMVKKMATIGMVDGLILKVKKNFFGVGCAYGKNHRKQFPWNELRERSQLLGDLVHINVCDPMQQTNKGGTCYFVLFKDDATRFKMIECIKSKTKDVVLACLKQFMAQLRHETRNMLKNLCNDRGSEFISVDLKSYLEQLEIKQKLTTNYTPKQNDASKKDNWTIGGSYKKYATCNQYPHSILGGIYEYNNVCTQQKWDKNTG